MTNKRKQNEKRSFEAQLLHVPYNKPDAHNALSMPVYNAVAFEFKTAEEMEEAFCGRNGNHYYSRVSNPTVQYLEDRVREVTGALSVTAFNSGMAAISNTFLALASNESNIIASPHLFGNTYSLLANTLPAFGVEPIFCDLTNPREVEAAINAGTCCVFLEVITNPQMEVAPLRALADICRAHNIPLIADTTLVPFPTFKAKDFGVDIEVISSTKYLSGGATGLGGLVIDYGPQNHKGIHTYFSEDLRKKILRNMGSYMTPQVAYMQTLGLETLAMRFECQAATCLELAKQLELTEGILSVNYPGLASSPFHAISTEQFGPRPGAMLTFNLQSREACFSFLNRLKLIRRATNLFDNKSLALHPASTIYGTYHEKQRQEMHISQQTIRLSIGLESPNDLYNDILQAL